MITPQGQRTHTGLLERLMEVVRPEFRGEVFYPPPDSAVFRQGVCRIPSCGIALSFASKQLCQGHYQRWKKVGQPDLDVWTVTEDQDTVARRRIGPCEIAGCNRARKGYGLCHRHAERWLHHGRPDLPTWQARTLYTPSRYGERDCTFAECPRWTDGPNMVLCRGHWERWRMHGRPTPLADWFVELEQRQHPHIRLHDLGRQLRLEVQYGLQQRYDIGTQHTAPRVVTTAVGWLRRAGVSSLMEWDNEQWRAFARPRPAHYDTLSLAFIKDTRFHLHGLLIADDPWADQYPRDTWDLRHLGVDHEAVRYLRFGGIPQPWLRELVKRWCRWRLSRGLDPSTVAIDTNGCTHLGQHLAAADGADATPETLTRQRIETWLAALQADRPDPNSRAHPIHSVGAFLRDVHRHEWQPDLPPSAFIHDDAPKRARSKPRFIPEQIMRQLETPEAIAQFPSDDGRLMLQIVMACGLRLKDARWLPFECVVRDEAGNPYLAWLNRKMHDRPAFFPLSEDLAGKIMQRQRAVLNRFPAGSPWLFPAVHSNLDGSKPVRQTRLRKHLSRWLANLRVVDELGRPVTVTYHQFRHTLGTRLINADVPQPVVQALLDHMSPDMTAVYARLHNDTIRRHWERAVKVNSEGQPASIPANHPLADGNWARLSMVRAKVTLPNGYCGAPIQTDCEYANPCLDCRFFITTADFLDQHRQQRDQTAQMIADANQAGLARVAEKNTRTLSKLDNIIGALEAAGPNQIVAGGKVEDLDAAG